MSDSQRSWLRRIGTVAGLAMMAYGLYKALIHKVSVARPLHKPGTRAMPVPGRTHTSCSDW